MLWQKQKKKMTNQLKAGSILSYLQMGINIIIGLLYTPVMIRLLGNSEYGLYNTVSSTISMLSILSLGFMSGYIRFYSRYKKEEDYKSIYKLNGLYLIVFTVIGLIALVCGLFLSFHLEIVFDEGLTAEEYNIAKILMLILTINLAVSFPLSVFSNIISAHEKFVFLKTIGMIKTVLGPLVTLPLLLFGFRSIAMVAVTSLVSLIADILYVIFVLFKMKEKFIFSGFDHTIIKSIFFYTSFIAINTIIDQINWNVDKVVIGRFKGTAEVAVYSTGYTLYHLYQMFSTSVSSVFTPRIHKMVRDTKEDPQEQKKIITDLFIKVGRIQFLILGLIASGLVFFGKFFIVNIWVGDEYSNSYYVMLLLTLPASIALIQNLGIEIQRAENKHQFRSIAYLIMAMINLVLSVILCKLYGAIGSTIGTAVSLILANGLIMNLYYHKKCNIDIVAFWKSIIRLSLGLVIPVFIGVVAIIYIDVNSVPIFALCVLVYSIVYCLSMWLLGMNEYEKRLVKKPLTRFVRRTKEI